MFILTFWWYCIWKNAKKYSRPIIGYTLTEKKRTYVYSKTKQIGSARGCWVCGKSNDCCYWIGCSHTNKMAIGEDCNCWVHQCCTGWNYKTEQKLMVVLVLLKNMVQKSKHKTNVILKNSKIYTLNNTGKHT